MSSKLLLLSAAALILSPSLASARDGVPYIGIEGGVTRAEDIKFDYRLNNLSVNNGIVLEHNTGFDADVILGYDFGLFRAEGELGWKRLAARDIAFNPAIAFAATGRPTVDGNTRVYSAMANLLLDFGSDDGLQVYGGGGIGAARVTTRTTVIGPGVTPGRGFNGNDRSLAWQLIAGMRVPVSYNVDLGLKYRYFRTDLDFRDARDPLAIETLDGRYKSHSLLASLIFNLGSPPAPLAPPPPPVVIAPPPPPPATQTCPDGSVILATDACPVPPPPPPPPPAAPERG